MKDLKERLTGSTINEAKVNLSDDIRDCKAIIMPGQTEMGDFGVIIGEPFKAMYKPGRVAAEGLIKTLGLRIGNGYDDIINTFEEEGLDLVKLSVCYFMSTDGGTVDCYAFGNGGVYVIK